MSRALHITLLAVLVVLLAPPAQSLAAKARGAGSCNGAHAQPREGNLDKIAKATLCLVNTERTTRNLKPLRTHRALDQAAERHSQDMAERGYFAHDSRDGTTFSKRILNANYTKPNHTWSLAENLAWATGQLATPAATVEAWMRSPGHRHTILTPRYREIGIGLAQTGPKTLYTTDYGHRG